MDDVVKKLYHLIAKYRRDLTFFSVIKVFQLQNTCTNCAKHDTQFPVPPYNAVNKLQKYLNIIFLCFKKNHIRLLRIVSNIKIQIVTYKKKGNKQKIMYTELLESPRIMLKSSWQEKSIYTSTTSKDLILFYLKNINLNMQVFLFPTIMLTLRKPFLIACACMLVYGNDLFLCILQHLHLVKQNTQCIDEKVKNLKFIQFVIKTQSCL